MTQSATAPQATDVAGEAARRRTFAVISARGIAREHPDLALEPLLADTGA